MKRIRFEGPYWGAPYHVDAGHGGDEYGNCSLYFRTPLFGIVWFYPTGHYQTAVEMPELGECKWVDVVFYDEK